MSSSILQHLCNTLPTDFSDSLLMDDSVYSLFSALIMHVYQMRSSVPSVVTATQDRLQVCMHALREVSKVWLVAKMVHTLFESILGNKVLEDKLQKAAGRRHKNPKVENRSTIEREEPQQMPHKRKYAEMEIGVPNGPPAPQVSYERSRPQTPAVTPHRDGVQQAVTSVGNMSVPTSTDGIRQSQQDAFMGSSRNATRPPTPFNSAPLPTSPPDFYLVTRDSPRISQQVWENFQPGYLFPENSTLATAQLTGEQSLDPQLQIQPSAMLQPPTSVQQPMSRSPISVQTGLQQTWQDPFAAEQGPGEHWNASNRDPGPVAPTTLNMDDW